MLHKLHKQGQLLQPLQANSDVRIIRAGSASSDAPAVLQYPSTELDRQPQPVLQHQQAGMTAVQGSSTLASDPGIRTPAAAGHSFVNTNDGNGPPAAAGNTVSLSMFPGEELYAPAGPLSAESCLQALQSGFTLVLRDMPKRCAAVGLLTEALETQMGLHAGANLYITPAGE